MIKLASLAALLALAGCPLQKSGSTTTLGGPSSGGSATGGGDNPGVSGDATITMPDLLGKTLDEATALVRAAGFKHALETKPIACDGPAQPEGTIDCQDPEPGKSVKAYTLAVVNVKRSDRIANTVLRRDLEPMAGMTIEQAKAAAKKVGHDGEVRVEKLREFRAGCKENTVCEATDERGGQSGFSIHDPLVLWINKTLSIAPPPD